MCAFRELLFVFLRGGWRRFFFFSACPPFDNTLVFRMLRVRVRVCFVNVFADYLCPLRSSDVLHRLWKSCGWPQVPLLPQVGGSGCPLLRVKSIYYGETW